MITLEQLNELKKADIYSARKDDLVDITKIKIDIIKYRIERDWKWKKIRKIKKKLLMMLL